MENSDVWIIVNSEGEVTDVIRPSDKQTLTYDFVKSDSRVYNELNAPSAIVYTPIQFGDNASAYVFDIAATPAGFVIPAPERLYSVLSVVEVTGDISPERVKFELENLVNTFPHHRPPKANIEEFDCDWRKDWQPGLCGSIGLFQSDWKDVADATKQHTQHTMGIHYYAGNHRDLHPVTPGGL